MTAFRDKILAEAGKYYQELDGDFSHDINHFLRVERLVKKIGEDNNKSAINYLLFKISHPKMQPQNFHTKLGRELAKERFAFVNEFARRFIAEWEGKE